MVAHTDLVRTEFFVTYKIAGQTSVATVPASLKVAVAVKLPPVATDPAKAPAVLLGGGSRLV